MFKGVKDKKYYTFIFQIYYTFITQSHLHQSIHDEKPLVSVHTLHHHPPLQDHPQATLPEP